MSWKKFWLYTALSVVVLVAGGYALFLGEGGSDNPDVVCDLVLRRGDC